MHILFIPSWYPENSDDICGSFFREQAQLLCSAGHEVGVLSSHISNAIPMRYWLTGRLDIENEAAVHTWRQRLRPIIPGLSRLLVPYRSEQAFKLYCKRHGMPDILHGMAGIMGGAIAQRLATKSRLPFIVTEHASRVANGVSVRRLKKAAYKAYINADTCLAVSTFLANRMRETLGLQRELVVVPNPLSPLFEGQDFVPPTLQPQDTFRFINVGNLVPVKNQEMCIEAFASAFRGCSCELIIAGSGPLKSCLEKRIAVLNMEGQIHLLGRQPREKVLRYMRNSHAYVLSSRCETFGIALIEAHSCGLPTVTTNCGGPADIVHEGNGVLVDDLESPAALAGAMRFVYEHREKYDPRAIREVCLARFSGATFVQTMTDIYRKATR